VPVFFAIVLPMAIMCIVYFCKTFRKKRKTTSPPQIVEVEHDSNSLSSQANVIAKENPVQESEQCQLPQIEFENSMPIQEGSIIKIFTLLDFTRDKGKMQIVKNKVSTETYCTFTLNGIVTKVEFSPTLGDLSAQEIVQRKFSLCVIQYDSGKYELNSL
jgi:hypothetical protein